MKLLNVLVFALLIFSIGFVSAEVTGNTVIWGGETGVGFSLSSTNPQCVNNNTAWQVGSQSGGSSSTSDCYRVNGYPSTTCCPSGQSCNITSNSCYSPVTSINFCRDYKTKTDCENANAGVGEASVEQYKQDTNFCNYGSYDSATGCTLARSACSCMWFNSTGRCDFNYTEVKSCPSGTGVGSTVGNCAISLGNVNDNCNTTSTLSYDAIATWTGQLNDEQKNCVNKTVVAQCGSLLKLPFFGWFNVIIAVVVIVAVYFVVKRKFIK